MKIRNDFALKPTVARNYFLPVGELRRARKHLKQDQRRIKRDHGGIAQLVVKAICEPGSKEFRQER
jgi:hypothetical protein